MPSLKTPHDIYEQNILAKMSPKDRVDYLLERQVREIRIRNIFLIPFNIFKTLVKVLVAFGVIFIPLYIISHFIIKWW